jgi:hypothetical protein
MPRAGAVTLSDVIDPTLTLVCKPCGRKGVYSIARLRAKHGDAKLPDCADFSRTIVPSTNRPTFRAAARRYLIPCLRRGGSGDVVRQFLTDRTLKRSHWICVLLFVARR